MNQNIKALVTYFGGQARAASKLKVKQPTVSGWVTGKHGMSAKVAFRAQHLTEGKFKAADLCPSIADDIISVG